MCTTPRHYHIKTHIQVRVIALLETFYTMQKGKKEKEKEKSEKKSKKSIVKEPEPPEQNLLGDLVSLDTPTQSLQPTILGLETLQVCI